MRDIDGDIVWFNNKKYLVQPDQVGSKCGHPYDDCPEMSAYVLIPLDDTNIVAL